MATKSTKGRRGYLGVTTNVEEAMFGQFPLLVVKVALTVISLPLSPHVSISRKFGFAFLILPDETDHFTLLTP
jgi:hypothetical protein